MTDPTQPIQGKCNGLLSQCRKCHYVYSAQDTELGLVNCPECGEPRGLCRQAAGWGTDHPGEGRCKLHAGQSLKGPAHPRWNGGGTSKYTFLPQHYRDAVKELVEAGDLVQVAQELAISRQRLRELMARLDADATPAVAIQAAQEQLALLLGNVRKFQEAVAAEDTKAARVALENLDRQARAANRLLTGAMADYQLWDEINQQMGMVARMADTQRRIESDVEATVRADRLQAMMEWVVVLIAGEVLQLEGGKQAVSAIITQIRSRVAGEISGGPGATG